MERERLRHVFERGLENPVGMVLPLQRGAGKLAAGMADRLVDAARATSISAPWRFSRRPAAPAAEFALGGSVRRARSASARSHGQSRPPAGSRTRTCPCEPSMPDSKALKKPTERDRLPEPGESAPWVVRTALCVEPRDGRLHVFMPPVEEAEDYVDLLAALEDTAAHLNMPVVIEGYPPPRDARIEDIKVTPDPGVIEVNVHPAAQLAGTGGQHHTIYEEARQSRLGTEKFMLDGRHTGTGGGNHLVLGGATPADSPFLRRPDLLRSMLGYWLNHPALS